MLVLLSCAKTMSETSKVKVPLNTVPRFQKEASEIALQMSQFSVDELEHLLRVNAKIAVENYKRYQVFHAEGTPELPALLRLVEAAGYYPFLSVGGGCRVAGTGESDNVLLLAVPSDGYIHRRYKERGWYTLQFGK